MHIYECDFINEDACQLCTISFQRSASAPTRQDMSGAADDLSEQVLQS